jgi:hypothetical protein
MQITTDTVCDQCHNVWLSNLENAVKPLTTPLIQGSEDVIIKPADQWTPAAWAFKMALLEIAAKENPQPFFTAAERKQFRETLIPSEKVRVFLAQYEYGQHPAHAAVPLHTLIRGADHHRTRHSRARGVRAMRRPTTRFSVSSLANDRERQAAGVTKSSRILNAAEEPLSTRTSSTYRIASRKAVSRLSSSGLA